LRQFRAISTAPWILQEVRTSKDHSSSHTETHNLCLLSVKKYGVRCKVPLEGSGLGESCLHIEDRLLEFTHLPSPLSAEECKAAAMLTDSRGAERRPVVYSNHFWMAVTFSSSQGCGHQSQTHNFRLLW
jgi:hypothetical protein